MSIVLMKLILQSTLFAIALGGKVTERFDINVRNLVDDNNIFSNRKANTNFMNYLGTVMNQTYLEEREKKKIGKRR